MHIKTLRKIFPYLSDNNKMYQLKMDKESLYSISIKEDADKISSLILHHVKKLKLNPFNIKITDATAGVGGNTISFARIFQFVNSIELDKTRCTYLENNVQVYGIKNIMIYNDDCLDKLKLLDHDIVFFDPPWGGKDYKIHTKMRLSLSDIQVEDICNDLLINKNYKQNPTIIVLKLPFNYDIQHIYNKITQGNIYLYILKKMQVVIIINQSFCLM
jgi:16S rRNA G966 N2-methylase RsmD